MTAVLVLTALLSGCAGQGGAGSTPVATASQAPAATAVGPTAVATITEAAPPPPTTTAPAQASPTLAPTATAAATPTPAATATARPAAALPTAATLAAPAAPDLAALQLDLQPVASGLAAPLGVTNAGDASGRLFVVEKTGAIRIITPEGTLLEQPLLDITDRVGSRSNEQGLLGLAFPPDYATRKFFFVNYTDKNGDTVVSRFDVTADPDVADAAAEFVVLTIDQPAANHNGGNLVFGPDGFLWIGTGDGGGANDTYRNGQNPRTWLGKMLRIDVTSDPSKPYVVPPDNPSLARKWDVQPEIWAIGLRNPWRYSFDRATGDLWIGDVGQGRVEEIDVVRAGAAGGLNFGWPLMEGPNCFQQATCDKTGLVLPVASYEHAGNGCSVTGGFVYRGKQFPALQGLYLYGDYCTGRMWAIEAANPASPVVVLEAGAGLSSFGEDEAGELYITNLSTGTLRQILAK